MRKPAPNLLLRLTERPYNYLIYAFFLIAAIWFVVRIAVPFGDRLTHGFGAYYSASKLLYTGEYSERVYEPDYFEAVVRADSVGEVGDIWLNPPPTTLLFLPIAGFSIHNARAIWTAINIFLLLLALTMLIRSFARGAPLVIWLLIFSLALLFRPVISNFIFGQGYILIFLLLAVAVVGIYRQKDISGGLSLGLAFSLKLVGWPLVFLLVWQRRWRYLVFTFSTIIFIVLASLPFFGLDSWRGFISFVSETSASPLNCVTAYQTTRSWLCHMLAPDVLWQAADSLTLPWFAPVILVVLGVVALVLSLSLANREPMAAAGALIAWGILFAPLGEEYHQVVLLIPIVWLILTWWSGRPLSWPSLILLTLALFLYMVPFPINHPRLQQGWLALLAYPRLYAAWLVWLTLILSSWWPRLTNSHPEYNS